MKRKLLVVLTAVIIVSMMSAAAGASSFMDKYKGKIKDSQHFGVLISKDSLWGFEGEDLMNTVDWDMLALDEETTLAYPELARTIDEISNQRTAAFEKLSEDFAVLAKESYNDYGVAEFGDANFNCYVQRADNAVLSFVYDSEVYWGGRHAEFIAEGMSIAPGTGEVLALSDVVSDTYAIRKLLARRLEEKYPYDSFGDLDSIIMDYPEEELEWTLGYDGITFYFGPYTVLNYPSDIVKATIGYDEAYDIFNPDFMYKVDEHGAYAVRIPTYEAINIDLASDGIMDTIELIPWMNEYETYDIIEILINGEAHQIETYAYEFMAYLAVMGAGETQRCYLYLETIQPDGDDSLLIVDLNGAEPRLVEEFWGTGFEGGIYNGKAVFMDPINFVLETRLDIIGTRFGTRACMIDAATGLPVPQHDYYVIGDHEYPLTSLIPLTVKMLDTNAEETIPAGATFYEIRTDGESYMDFMLEDGRECRIEVDTSEYPFLINGIDETECFEGFGYAG